MKKLLLSLLFVVLFAPTALGYSSWNLQKHDQDIEVLESGKLRITETIVADFTRDSHRGIERYIPISYKDQFGNPFNLRFKLISITDENGDKHNIDEKGKELFSDFYYMRIGDPDVWRDDVVTYVITFEIDRAVGYFDDHDEIYWNLFTDWDIPVLSSNVTVTLPEAVSQDETKTACYTGYYGASESNCESQFVDGKTFTYKAKQVFEPGEGFTIVAGFPKGIIKKPSILQQVWWFIWDNWALLIPIAVFIFLYLKWWFTGRDPQTKDTIIPRYKPPEGLTPTEVGTIVDEKVDIRDITSVVIDYAVRGFIKIKELKTKKLAFFDETDYELEILKDYNEHKGLQSHEKEVLDNIFGKSKNKKLSELKYKFYSHLKTIKKDLYKDLVKNGYFVHNPDKIREIYTTVGSLLAFGPIFFIGALVFIIGGTLSFSIMASGVLILIFGRFMPRKTLKGARTYIEIKGLEEYIRTAEKDRIKFQEDQNIFFEKLLPYAMVLGLGDKWAEAFKDIYKKPPSWFDAKDTTHFDTYHLVNRLNNFSTHAQTAFASSPRSSGGGSSAWSGGSGFSGGFSGGGFGGGGGGGW